MKIKLQHLLSCIVFTVILPLTLIAQDATSIKKDTIAIKKDTTATKKDTTPTPLKKDTTITLSRPDKPVLKIGGALRFNYNLSSWKKEQVKRGGDFGLDMFRINADVAYKKLDFHAEYRFYAKDFGGSFLKEGYVSYLFNDSTHMDIGLVQNPFGNTTYNSHNWFFNLPYYVGFEDKFSMGVNFHQRRNRWIYDIAFFKNAMELNFGDKSGTDPSRYSYDVAGRNKEVNQGNIKTEYLIAEDKKIGISGMIGGVYNIPTGRMGARWAAALHTDLRFGKLNVKLQSMYYQYNLSDSSQYKNIVQLAAYGSSYDVARKAYLHTASFAYTQPVKLGPVKSLVFYENYSYMNKPQAGFKDTQMNVLGCMINAGNLVTYVDWAAGKNQPWLGPDWQNGLSAGNPDSKWSSRFNINIGYYF